MRLIVDLVIAIICVVGPPGIGIAVVRFVIQS